MYIIYIYPAAHKSNDPALVLKSCHPTIQVNTFYFPWLLASVVQKWDSVTRKVSKLRLWGSRLGSKDVLDLLYFYDVPLICYVYLKMALIEDNQNSCWACVRVFILPPTPAYLSSAYFSLILQFGK